MAAESTINSSPRTPGGRTTPVLVPQGALAGRPDIPLDRAVTTVGSSETSRLHLISRTVSKSHALLVNSNGGTYVADLASRTGVLVNGKVVKDAELKTGDRVQIGKFLFRYRSPTTPSGNTQVEPPAAAVIVVGSPAIPITGRIISIGRRETSEVALPGDSSVSAAHAVIFQVDGKWVMRDLGSRTGTIINAKKVNQQALNFGDRIQIGSANILFQPAKEQVPQPVEHEDPAPIAMEEAPLPVAADDIEAALPLADEPVYASEHVVTATVADEVLSASEPEPIAVEPEPVIHGATIQHDAIDDESPIGFAPETGSATSSVEAAIPVEAATPLPVETEPHTAAAAHESEAVVESSVDTAADAAAETGETVEPSAPIEFAADSVEAEALATLAEVPPEAPVHPPIEISAVAVNAEVPNAVDESPVVEPASEPQDAAFEPIELGESAAAETPEMIEPIDLATEPAESVEVEPSPTVETATEVIAEQPIDLAESVVPVDVAADEPLPVETSHETETAEHTSVDVVEPSVATEATAEPIHAIPLEDVAGDHTPAVETAPAAEAVYEPIHLAEPSAVESDAIESSAELAATAEAHTADTETVHEVSLAEPVETVEPVAIEQVEHAWPIESTPAPEAARETIDAVEPTAEIVAAPVEAAPFEAAPFETGEPIAAQPEPEAVDVASHAVETEEPVELEDLPAAESVVSSEHAESPTEIDLAPDPKEMIEPVSLDETVPVEPVEIPAPHVAIEEPVESFEPAVEHEAANESLAGVDVEPASTAPASNEAEKLPEATSIATAAGDLPDVMFWGDPELDAETEQAILGPTDTQPAVAAVPAEPAVEVAATVPQAAVEPIEPIEPAPTPEPTNIAAISESEPIGHIEDIAFGEPEIAEDSAISNIETVFGEVVPVPVDDFSPEGTVSITTDAPAGDSQAVVNEYMFGDEESPVVATDEAAMVTESLTTDLPETEELMTGEGIDAPIEGVDEVASADAPVVDDTNVEDLIWVDDASPVEAVDDLSLGVGPTTRIIQAQPMAQPSGLVVETFTASEIEEDTDDLEFLDFGDEPGVESNNATIVEPVDNSEVDSPVVSAGPPQPEPAEPVAQENPPEKSPEKSTETLADFVRTEEPKPRPGPSLFGFDFEGGSFLGGMPLQLNANTAAATAAAAGAITTTAAAAAGLASALKPGSSTVFDVQSRAPSGLGGRLSKPPTVRSRSSTPSGELPRPIPRPTPPAPTGPDGRIHAAPMSLMDLGADTRSRPSGPPQIPPTAKEVARTNNTPEAPATPAGRSPAGAAKKPVSLDVFSQVSAPIGVEVFGGKQAAPTLKIPDASETLAKSRIDNPLQEDKAIEAAASAPVTAYVPPPRRSKIPMLLLMIPLFIIASGVAIFTLVPSSANIIGTLKFAGVSSQNSHDFWYLQKKRLREPGIRSTAQAILTSKKVSPGFVDDPIAYDHAIENVSWPTGSDTFQFDYFSYDPKAGVAQVTAVLEALRSADKDLDDAKARALDARDQATEARKSAHETVDSLVQQEKVQRQLAQDTTDAGTLSQLDNEAAKQKQNWSDAKTSRDTSASVLAGFRAQDPTKPIDVEHDDQVLSLKAKLDQVNDQISRAKSASGSTGAGSTGAGSDSNATTQPSDAAPILSVLQPEADRYALMLKHRQDELAAEASLTPDQRTANLQNLIENMSVKLTALDRTLADAKDASDQAAAAADAAHKRDDAARIAGAKLDDLLQKQQAADVKLTAAIADEKDKQAALDACVTVVPDSPINVGPEGNNIFNPQWPAWLGFSGLIVLVLGLMILGEAKRPQVIPGETPVAAPLRTIPWPKQEQLEGLNDVQAQEPEQYIGV